MIHIHSFSDVPIRGQKVLILCDIDDTLLKWKCSITSFYAIAMTYFPTESPEIHYAYAKNKMNVYRQSEPPIWTDKKGFADMITKLTPESKMIFLTARTGGIYANWTKRDFAHLGIPYDDSSVFYTCNKMSKGEYIRLYIPIEGFDQVIFIDDMPDNIRSVQEYFPNIECFRWMS